MSKKEAQKAFELDLLVKAGEVLKWERQKKIRLDVNGYHICNYFIDFVIYWKGGDVEYCEIKGFETDVWRLKWRLMEALFSKDHPEYKLTVEK